MPKRNIIHAIALPDPSSSTDTHPLAAKWAILVQPKKIHHWFRVESPPAVLVSSHGIINDAPPSSFLVKVLIGENDVQGVDHKVQDALNSLSSSSGDAEACWLKDAVGTLQYAGLIDSFDVAEFVQMAGRNLVGVLHKDNGGGGGDKEHSSEAGGPLEIDYEGRPLRQASPGLEEKVAAMKQKEKKKGGLGFWVSHGPNATYGHPRTVSQRNSWEREDDAYGGLM